MSDPMNRDGDQQPARRDRRRDVRVVATGLMVVLLVWFALANLQDVHIHFWVTSTQAPLIAVIVIAVVLGVAVTVLVSRFARRRQRPEE